MAALPPALEPLRARPESAGLFVDFDGTLAAIVDDPLAARPLPGAADVLARLAARYAVVAVVSGRPVTFLHDALGRVPGLRVVGLYGMEEWSDPGPVTEDPGAARWRPVVARVTERARAKVPAGAEVEPKGLTVTLHWRGNPAAEGWARDLAAWALADGGLVAQPGRMALELRPPIETDKGTVVRRLGLGLAAAAAFGDDLGDLPAFAALGDLARAGAAVARVAVTDAESPPEVVAAADVVVEGPVGALELLWALAGP
ncbi:MAG: trehalose-phosphatase [Acidimicrobiales bacterium]